MRLFGKKIRTEVIMYELDAIANCAVHPKYLDDSIVAEANVDSDYLDFSGRLSCFVDTVEEKYAAENKLQADFVLNEWTRRNMDGLSLEFVPMRIAQVHFQRLMDHLG